MGSEVQDVKKEIDLFKRITNEMLDTFEKKRNDYGPSTTETWVRFGPVSMLTRMYDKLSRISNLFYNDSKVKDEKLVDTLLDLANYAIITIIEMTKFSNEE